MVFEKSLYDVYCLFKIGIDQGRGQLTGCLAELSDGSVEIVRNGRTQCPIT